MRTPTSLGVARAAGESLVTAAPGGPGQNHDASMEVMETCKDAANRTQPAKPEKLAVCEDAQKRGAQRSASNHLVRQRQQLLCQFERREVGRRQGNIFFPMPHSLLRHNVDRLCFNPLPTSRTFPKCRCLNVRNASKSCDREDSRCIL